jgi:hypothetical protein
VSLGIFGDVFEVMAQVDRRLPKSTPLTGSLGLINLTENLGRHSSQAHQRVLPVVVGMVPC